MADEDLSLAVEDDGQPADDGSAVAGPFALDEQSLGQSSSVFGDAAEVLPPMTAPPAVPLPDPAVPAPQIQMSQRERRRRVRLEARRVRRVVRHIEPWSVFKISVIFYICLWLIFLLAGVLLWSWADDSGTLTSIEDLVEDLFSLDPEEELFSGSYIFNRYAIATMFLSIAGVAFNVLLCVLYNLISDLTGGVRITVIEEESARFQPERRLR